MKWIIRNRVKIIFAAGLFSIISAAAAAFGIMYLLFGFWIWLGMNLWLVALIFTWPLVLLLQTVLPNEYQTGSRWLMGRIRKWRK
jgi:hypothetical protein